MSAQTNVVTQHNDIGRTGQNTTETVLTQANVNSTSFGKLFTLNVDGLVFAQPLYMSNVSINGTSHRVVFVATEHDSVYAFDAASGTQLWQASLLDALHGAAPGATTDPVSDSGCAGVNQYGGAAEYGITGTPVIDAATGTLYVVSMTYEGTYPVARLHALDVATGNEKFGGPVALAASTPGTGIGSSNGVLSFDPRWALQRAGLLEVGGNVYISFGSHCDYDPWHGWILGYNASTLAQTAAIDLSPNGYGSGVWMGGAGLSADIQNNVPRIFPVTGNGTFDATAPYSTTGMDYSNTILRLDVLSNGNVSIDDLFAPSNQAVLSSSDTDLGGGGALLLPDQPGSTPHLLATLGKPGVLYLANRDNLGGYNTSTDNVVQELPIGSLLIGSPAYWNGNLYLWPGGSNLSRYPLSNGLLPPTPSETSAEVQRAKTTNYGLTPSISSNGVQNGIVWSIDWTQSPQVLYAHNASNVSQLLWSSAQNAARDAAGSQVKMVVPTVADGNVFVGSASQVLVYGLFLAPQTLTFSPVTVASGATQTTLSASASSGLPVTFTSSTTSVCTTTGSQVSFLMAGTCTIVASQAGNVAYAPATNVSQSFSVSPSGVAPPASPVISAVTVTGLTSSAVTITWTTDQATTSVVNYGPDTSYGASSPVSSALSNSHSVTLTALNASSTYNFEVVSANSGGSSSTSTNYTFTTLAPPGPPPNLDYVAYWSITSSGITVSWSTDVLGNTVLAYGTTAALGQLSPVQAALTANHQVVLTGLNPGTTYYFQAQSTGANGSTGYSTTYSFTTAGLASGSPVITNVATTNITGTTVAIKWTTDQPTTSQVGYGTTSLYGASSTLDPTLVTAHSVTITGLTAGTTYDYYVASSNPAGSSATSTNCTFTTSAATGLPVITNVAATNITGTSVTITWSTDQATTSLVNYGATASYGSSSPVASALVMSHSVTLTGLSAGTTYNYDVVSANSGNTAATSGNFTFATSSSTGTPPNVGNVAYWGITSSGITVSWSSDVAGSTALAYGTTAALGQLSPVQTALTPNHEVILTGLNPGTTYYFAAQSTGANGATGYSTIYSFTTAGAASALPVITNVVASSITGTSVTISWTTDQATTSQVGYGTTSLYGSSSTLGTTFVTSHSVTLTGLTAGTTYNYYVISTNSSGTSATSANYTFTTSALVGTPVITNVAATNITGTSVTITWTTDQATTSQVNYGGTTTYNYSSPVATTLVTSHSVTLTGLTAGSTYDYDVVSVNSANTSSTSANYTFATSSSTGTPPNVSDVAYWSITNSGITVSWATDVVASSALAYGTTAALGQLSPVQATLASMHEVVLTGLNPGTTYYFAAESTGANGATGYSTIYSFTTGGVAAASPVISNVTATSITTTSVTITWSTDQATTSLVNYGATTSYGSASPAASALVTSHSITLSGLTAGTTYNYDVVSANASNTTSTSGNYTFTTSPSTGTTSTGTPPNITNVAYWGITSSGITVSWSSDVASTTALAYGTATALGQVSPVQATLSSNHEVVLTGLNPGTTYYFAAESTGSNGATGTSTTYSFTTGGAATGLPIITNIAAANITPTSVTITWTTDQATTSQVSYGTTSSYGSSSALSSTFVTSHSVTLTGLTAGTTYDYYVSSANSSGTSATSTNYTFATSALSGTPVITNVAATNITGTSVVIAWTTDQATTSLVNYGSTTSYGSVSPLTSALATNHSVTLSGLTPGSTYDYDVVSANSASTVATSANYKFTTSSSSAPSPNISNVAYWGITSSGITVSWSTDMASNSALAYGTTAALGQLSPVQTTQAASHLVVLSGLNPGTTYYFEAQSTAANGATGYSTTYSFTTNGASGVPVISGIVVVPGSNNTATISWTTSVPTYSYVQYGSTTSYTGWSSLSALTTNPQLVLSNVADGIIHYQLVSTDAYGNQVISPDYTFTEP